MMDDPEDIRTPELNRVIRAVLGAGAATSAVLLALGLAMSVLLRQPLPTVALSPGEALRQVAALQAGGVVTLGLLVLLATPALMMAGTLVVCVRQRDWPFAAVSLTILAIMAVGVLISSR